MILVELELENYKQFVGPHRFEPTASGVVGIIGPNGVGKTTLFEAIEWCLFNPTDVKNDEIPPRGKAGRPRVKVVLDDPIGGVRYVIQRELMKSGVKAEIWTGDETGARIVHGSRQVTDYVTKTLLGLDHRAFVSTFFTRQKELSFFAGGAADRRREVSRLLGYETIRGAQKLIAEDRRIAEADATSLSLQYQELSEGRDFAQEIASCDAEIESSEEVATKAVELLTITSGDLVSAREGLSALQALERQDNELLRKLERIVGSIREAGARRDSAVQELERIAESEKARAGLAPVAASEAERRASLELHERERDRFAELTTLEASLDRARKGIALAASDLERAVTSSESPAVPDWTWSKDDARRPVEAATRLIAIGEGLDIQGARAHYEALGRCFDRAQLRDAAEKKLQDYDKHLSDLETQRQELLAAGDPKIDGEEAAKQREAALVAAERDKTNVSGMEKSRREYEEIIDRLRSRQFDGPCPTCGRPFKEHEVALTLDALEDRVEQINGEIKQLELHERQHRADAESCERTRLDAEKNLSELHVLDGRISQGRPMVDSARAELDKAIADSARALQDCRLELPPTKDEVTAAKEHANALQRIGEGLGVVRQVRSHLTQLSEEISTTEQAIAALGPVVYEKDAHDAADAALAEARAAEATIRQIDREIARRPQLEADRDQANNDMNRLDAELQSLESERKELAFDPEALQAAVATEQAALDAERAALQARNVAENAQRAAESARKNLLDDQERITGLARRAEERRREADELQRMYKEFSSFDQYVVNLITPQMADHASQLVADVTEGKYDRIEFDDDYGIRVFDGDEDFPMDEFSGGERDVIALCARLALSRIVGGRASRPLSFLVLDEVFGSLDRDRREHLMSTLTQLSGTAEAFSQLFIISHVEDVRQAPDINEIWRISESSEGISHIENLTATGRVEEF